MTTKIDMISLNGQIFEPNQSRLSEIDQGFMYGLGVFETFRVSDGKVFLLEEHFERLKTSLAAMDIVWPDDRPTYKNWIREIADATHKSADVRVRFYANCDNGKTRIIIYSTAIDKLKPQASQARILKSLIRNKPEYFDQIGFRIKSPDYLSAHLAQIELPNGSEGILLSPKGQVAEALTSNIFCVKANNLYTPPLELGILPGIIRNYLISSQKVEEKLITAEDLISADEIFLTNSVNYLNPLNLINKSPKPGTGGQIYKKLQSKLITDIHSNNSSEQFPPIDLKINKS